MQREAFEWQKGKQKAGQQENQQKIFQNDLGKLTGTILAYMVDN